MNQWRSGAVAVSKAGHDRGEAFLILRVVDESFVLIADGKRRTLAHPKRKKRMHLALTPVWNQELADRMEGGLPVNDGDIRRAIRESGWDRKRQEQEG